ncbi:MAG TPA: flavodoxin domain-containing protein [Methanoregulaceae archaeon]|nr:MAG: flavodoxin domain-containing protein [Methanolinea sp.]HON82455.1 flavodoxin domain-containing protein [Methanoregulaceae archaeon]HPD11434.1 flavodoxin domain-containing protein [Methanoregulaceae archaeon]HRT16211.1 flavodoxin domain-containing protein [Methanoregulaceae archaeon]HRU31772.1 flavodoxin domain-containing protein [Methanoregulaceae archaeon]
MERILVCYATRYGSTRDIATIIADVLREAGYEVTLSPVTDAGDPAGYDAVVIGSPLYMGKWLVEAREFVSRFRYSLRSRPVAVFSAGFTLRDRTAGHLGAADGALASSVKPFLSPVSAGYFAGKLDPDHMTVADRAIIRLTGTVPGDFRDADEIKKWAGTLPTLLFC